MALSENAIKVLEKRYLAKDINGNIVETPEGMFRRVAKTVASADTGRVSEEKVKETEEEFYNLMMNLEFLPNSPTLMNAGRPLGQLSACFVLPIGDSMEEIFDSVKHAALIHKSGGGTGFSFSRLRQKGATVNSTGGVASGPVSFLKVFNAATEAVKQGGTRRGANMGILRVDHPDILEFISCKENNADITNFNISVGLTEDFMQAVESGSDYELIDPKSKKAVGKLSAPDVFNTMVKSAWKNGEPGVVFLDRLNRVHVTPKLGEIESTNPCVTGDTWVLTDKGPMQIQDIVGLQVNLALHGEYFSSAEEGFFETGVKEILLLTTVDGHTIKLTADHLVRTVSVDNVESWTPAGTLKQGDLLLLSRFSGTDKGNVRNRPQGEAANTSAPSTSTPSTSAPATTAVSGLSPAGKATVYDVRVPGVNAYEANGLVVHNCGEQPLMPYEACNLGSINLDLLVVRTEQGASVDYDRLTKIVKKSVHFLDNVIDVNKYPLPEISKMTLGTRKIGLGVMGWADMLLQLGIPYNSKEAESLAKKVMSHIAKESHEASCELAEKRGVFPYWEDSTYKEKGLRLRNATTTTIAPTGTLSMIAGVSSGVEPLFAIAYVKNVMDKTELFEINPHFKRIAEEGGFFSEALMQKVVEKGTVHGLAEVPEEAQGVFVTAHDISPEWHVRMQAAFQEHTDNAVSKTVNLSHEATEQDAREVFLHAYRTGCKGVTMYRDGSRSAQVLNVGGVKEQAPVNTCNCPENEVAELVHITPRPRPDITTGFTEKVKIGCGNLYITVNYDENGICEVFTNTGRAGGCPSQSEATSRLVSIALRSGMDEKAIVEQLKGIRCSSTIRQKGLGVLSCPDAIGRLIEKVSIHRNGNSGERTKLQAVSPSKAAPAAVNLSKISTMTASPLATERKVGDYEKGHDCPECGEVLEHEGGCKVCRSCGYSKCG